MISKFEEFEEICVEIDKHLSKKIDLYVIGGAAMLYYKTRKGYTKDIDVVFKNANDLKIFADALKKVKFKVTITPHSHNQLDIFERLEMGKYMFDLFAKVVCSQFCLSEGMIKRAKNAIRHKKLNVFICSREDILLLKSLSSSRPNDIEDTMMLINIGVDWDIIYTEIIAQVRLCPDKEKSKRMVWYFIERMMGDLIPREAKIPIKDKVMDFYDSLVDDNKD